MTDLVLWTLFGLFLAFVAWALPIALVGLIAGEPALGRHSMPPFPPTREAARRRARYFEDCQ